MLNCLLLAVFFCIDLLYGSMISTLLPRPQTQNNNKILVYREVCRPGGRTGFRWCRRCGCSGCQVGAGTATGGEHRMLWLPFLQSHREAGRWAVAVPCLPLWAALQPGPTCYRSVPAMLVGWSSCHVGWWSRGCPLHRDLAVDESLGSRQQIGSGHAVRAIFEAAGNAPTAAGRQAHLWQCKETRRIHWQQRSTVEVLPCLCTTGTIALAWPPPLLSVIPFPLSLLFLPYIYIKLRYEHCLLKPETMDSRSPFRKYYLKYSKWIGSTLSWVYHVTKAADSKMLHFWALSSKFRLRNRFH